MYQFSRSIYRELCSEVLEERNGWSSHNRERFLRACEAAFERLATDRHYFARPARSLFNEVRVFFPMSSQARVRAVIDRHMALATDYVDMHARAGVTFDGSPLCCHATTRKGTACQRVPLPGSQYCPSHKHLEEDFAAAEVELDVTAAEAALDVTATAA
jgi:hypothetical protein